MHPLTGGNPFVAARGKLVESPPVDHLVRKEYLLVSWASRFFCHDCVALSQLHLFPLVLVLVLAPERRG